LLLFRLLGYGIVTKCGTQARGKPNVDKRASFAPRMQIIPGYVQLRVSEASARRYYQYSQWPDNADLMLKR
jgi:hypothetical protein